MPVYPSTGVQLGDIRMYAYDNQQPDAHGTYWGLTQLEGWDDGWEGNAALTDRAAADGGWTSPQYAVPRVIQLGGTIEDDTWDDVTRAFQRLMTRVPFRQLGPITVSEGEGTVPEMMAMIRQHGKPMLPGDARLGGYAEFSLSLVAPDPRKYGIDLLSASTGLPRTIGGLILPVSLPIVLNATTVAGSIVVTNEGNEAAPATLTITGPCPPCTITHVGQGRRIAVRDAVEAGRTLVINTDTRRAVLDGTALRTVTGTWWQLDPGVNEIAFQATSYDPDALLTLSFRSAWR